MKMTIDEMIAVLQAAKEGKQIQYRSRGDSDWFTLWDKPVWNFDVSEYRVKPEEQTVWLTILRDKFTKCQYQLIHSSESEARRYIQSQSYIEKPIACVPVKYTEGEGL